MTEHKGDTIQNLMGTVDRAHEELGIKQQNARDDNKALMIACRKAANEIFEAQRGHDRASFPLPAVTVAAIIYRHVREGKEL